MQLTQTHKIIITIIIALVLFGIFVFFTKKTKSPEPAVANNATTTSQKIPGTDLIFEGKGDYTITQIPVETTKTPTMPDLKRVIVFNPSLNLNDEAKKILSDKISSLQINLKNDPKNIGNWILLGTNYKITGDYVGASIYWKYASDVSNDFVSLGNLGNLYAYYLNDKILSEVYYKKAISRSPTSAYLYIQLASVYKDIFKDAAKAKTVLDEGLSKIPNDPSLLEAKKNL